MTSASGFADTTASAVSRMRRKIFGRLFRNCREADNRKVSEWKQTGHSFGCHVGAADAGKMNVPFRPLLDRRDQRRAQPVARFFAGNQKDVRAHLSGPDDTPTTKILARSAAVDQLLCLGHDGAAGDNRNAGKTRTERRPRRSWGRLTANRNDDPVPV